MLKNKVQIAWESIKTTPELPGPWTPDRSEFGSALVMCVRAHTLLRPPPPPKWKSWIHPWQAQTRSHSFRMVMHGIGQSKRSVYNSPASFIITPKCRICKSYFLKKSWVNNSLHLWSEEILVVEEWISLDSNASRVKIHYSASEILSGSLDIHSKGSAHWHHYPRSENRVNRVIFFWEFPL